MISQLRFLSPISRKVKDTTAQFQRYVQLRHELLTHYKLSSSFRRQLPNYILSQLR